MKHEKGLRHGTESDEEKESTERGQSREENNFRTDRRVQVKIWKRRDVKRVRSCTWGEKPRGFGRGTWIDTHVLSDTIHGCDISGHFSLMSYTRFSYLTE